MKEYQKHIKPKICSICGTQYTPTSWNSKMTPLCSPECKAVARENRRKKVIATCLICQKEFIIQGKKLFQTISGRTFCSKECSAKSKSASSSITMAETNRKYASERMKKNNPMKKEDARIKMKKALTGRPFLHRMGNGQYTRHQIALFNALKTRCSESFVLEYPIKTAEAKTEAAIPNCYKTDIACPEHCLAIEIDGKSHKTTRGKNADKLKTNVLHQLGWSVLRFTNQQVEESLTGCVRTVMSTISK